MRKLAMVILAGCALTAVGAAANSPAAAQAVRSTQSAAAAQPLDATAQVRRPRARTQLRVYRDGAYLPPNAVRECNSWLEQEFRPSGTVIVPRMRCRWVAG